jgi:ABC-type sugar transport system permease subunit
VFCGPAVTLFAGFVIAPAILGFAYSFTDWKGWSLDAPFTGLANFRELLNDQRLASAIRFTLFETALIVIAFAFGAMLLAVLLDSGRSLRPLTQGLYFYPYVLSLLVSALLFQYLANYREGLVNTGLRALGMESAAQDWMGDVRLVGYFIFGLVFWTGLGFFTTLYLANLQTIPKELYEAARLDGAGPLSVFRHIQFPLLRPALTINFVFATIYGINLFGQILVTTEGGPFYRTLTIGYYVYWQGVLNDRQGYSAALSLVVFVAVAVIAVIQVTLLRRRETEM